MNGISVLMYHHVNPIESSNTVTPKFFAEHMRFLQSHGYTTIDTQEMVALLSGKRPIPPKAIMITFDDGWLDSWVFAFPILKKYNHKAVIFVVTSWVNTDKVRPTTDDGYTDVLPEHKQCLKMLAEGRGSDIMVSWEELRIMEQSGLIDVQSHTHAHIRWEKKFKKSEELLEALKEDLYISKREVDERLRKNCTALSWPWGKYNGMYIAVAQDVGFRAFYTTNKGTNCTVSDLMRLKRIVIGNISTLTLRKKLMIYSHKLFSKIYVSLKR